MRCCVDDVVKGYLLRISAVVESNRGTRSTALFPGSTLIRKKCPVQLCGAIVCLLLLIISAHPLSLRSRKQGSR